MQIVKPARAFAYDPAPECSGLGGEEAVGDRRLWGTGGRGGQEAVGERDL